MQEIRLLTAISSLAHLQNMSFSDFSNAFTECSKRDILGKNSRTVYVFFTKKVPFGEAVQYLDSKENEVIYDSACSISMIIIVLKKQID